MNFVLAFIKYNIFINKYKIICTIMYEFFLKVLFYIKFNFFIFNFLKLLLINDK